MIVCQSWSKWVVLLVILNQLLHFIFSVSLFLNKQHSPKHRAKLLLWPGQCHIQEECVPTEQQLRKCVGDTGSTYFQWVDSQNTPHLYVMTDGGPEHRVNFESIKIPLILMFKQLKLDSLLAICTAPGKSYVNIVERIMSILNTGFQNVALEREESGSDEEIR